MTSFLFPEFDVHVDDEPLPVAEPEACTPPTNRTPLTTPGGTDNCSVSNRTTTTSGLKPEMAILRMDAENPGPRFDAFAFRVRQFLSGLSPQRRAEIGQRGRFRSQPYLRRADEPDDDFLP